MKTNLIEVQAQQLCYDAAKEVFNMVETALQGYIKEGLIVEDSQNETKLTLSVYNRGYMVQIQEALWNWREATDRGVETWWTSMYIQPCTFFDQYIEEGEGHAYIEYGLPFPDEDGYATGRFNHINNLQEFKAATRKWVKMVKKQIEKNA